MGKTDEIGNKIRIALKNLSILCIHTINDSKSRNTFNNFMPISESWEVRSVERDIFQTTKKGFAIKRNPLWYYCWR